MGGSKELRPGSSFGRFLKVDRVLPGECPEKYEERLAQILKELAIGDQGVDAYLVELVYDALWWLKRNRETKAALVADEMVDHLCEALENRDEDPDFLTAKIFDARHEEELAAYLAAAGVTLTFLGNLAPPSHAGELRKIDEQSEVM